MPLGGQGWGSGILGTGRCEELFGFEISDPDWGHFGVKNFLVDVFGRTNLKRDILGSYAYANGLNF